jgi:tetratricopeptide (TPR) repeat protein
MIEDYTRRLPLDHRDNHHIKSIVKPASTLHALSPHHFAYREGCGAVNSNYLPISSPFGPACADTIRINHYFYRSQEEFERKIKRGRADTNAPELRRSIATFEHQQSAAHHEDLSAAKYLEKLKTLLKMDSAEEVIAWTRRSIAQDQPGYLRAFEAASRLGQTDRADLILREALARFPDDPALIAVRAGALRISGNTSRALAEAHRSLAIRPTPQALSELALLHAARGEHEMAEKLRAFQEFLAGLGESA